MSIICTRPTMMPKQRIVELFAEELAVSRYVVVRIEGGAEKVIGHGNDREYLHKNVIVADSNANDPYDEYVYEIRRINHEPGTVMRQIYESPFDTKCVE